MELRDFLDASDADLLLETISEKENKNVMGKLQYTWIVADKFNGNKRLYPESIVKREIKNFQQKLSDANIAGNLGHPTMGKTRIDRISHLISDVFYEEKSKRGICESLILRTTAGKDLFVLLNSDIKVGASLRGFGQVGSDGKVKDDFSLESIDIVIGQSFGADTEITKQNLIESGNSALFSASKTELTEDQKIEIRFTEAKKSGFKGGFETYKKEVAKK